LPDMTAEQVIKTLQKRNCSVPFIIITGHGDERIAVNLMKLGARDYMVKDAAFLDLLPTVVNRVMDGLIVESRLIEAEKAVRESEARYRGIYEYTKTGIAVLRAVNGGEDFVFVDINRGAEEIEKVKKDEIIGKSVLEVFPGIKNFGVFNVFQRALKTGRPEHHPISYYEDERIVGWRDSFIHKLPSGEIVTVYTDETEQKQAEEALRERKDELSKRVRELNCLYEISKLSEKPGISFEDSIQEIVVLIPSSWQYPEAACARAILENREFKTKKFKETPWMQTSDIIVRGERIGTLDLCYLEEKPERDEGPFLKEERSLLDTVAERLGEIAKRKRTEETLQQSYDKLQKAMVGIIEAMALTVEERDPYTAGHQRRVTNIALAIAEELGLSEDQKDGLQKAGLIHDQGKISIPFDILSKPGRLNEIEFQLIKKHPVVGYHILKDIEFPWPVARIVLQHHERINGSGYPNGLKAEDITIEAKILAVADVVEAMASHRPYRAALGIEKALEEIKLNRKTLYEPDVVDVCLRLFNERGFKIH
jgi:PAS domain S-box-containing protein